MKPRTLALLIAALALPFLAGCPLVWPVATIKTEPTRGNWAGTIEPIRLEAPDWDGPVAVVGMRLRATAGPTVPPPQMPIRRPLPELDDWNGILLDERQVVMPWASEDDEPREVLVRGWFEEGRMRPTWRGRVVDLPRGSERIAWHYDFMIADEILYLD